MKSYEEIVEILEAFALTNSYRAAGELAGCSHHTVEHWVTMRDPRARMKGLAVVCRLEFDPEGFVFTTKADGSLPLHPDTVTGNFRRVCERAGLTGVRLHDLRHLHATQLLAAGVPVRTVSGRLGHAKSATTLNVYAHFLDTWRRFMLRTHLRHGLTLSA